MLKKCVWNPAKCQNGKYLPSIMDDSAIIGDEVIESYDEEIKTIPTSFDEKKKSICKTQTITLLIALNIYCYLIKYEAKQKQKHLLSLHDSKLITNQ